MKKRRNYTREFKLAAVRKVVEQGMSMAEVARDLAVHETLIRNWKAKFEAEGALRAPAGESQEAELQRLREENKRLKMERDILKKATAFFANEKS